MKALLFIVAIFSLTIVFGSVKPKNQIHQLKERDHWKAMLNGKLVAHGEFICIKKLEISQEELSHRKMRSDMIAPTSIVHFYVLNSTEKLKYDVLKEKKVFLQTTNYEHIKGEIQDVVIVSDILNLEIYIAAQFSTEKEDAQLYYGVCLTASMDVSVQKEVMDFEDSFVNQFTNEPEFLSFDSLNSSSHVEYIENEVQEVLLNGSSYKLVQQRFVGVCGSIIASQVGVYEFKNGKDQLIQHFTTDQYVHGLLDTDSDGVLEVKLVSFASSSIHDITPDGLKLKDSLSWSFEGCPC